MQLTIARLLIKIYNTDAGMKKTSGQIYYHFMFNITILLSLIFIEIINCQVKIKSWSLIRDEFPIRLIGDSALHSTDLP